MPEVSGVYNHSRTTSNPISMPNTRKNSAEPLYGAEAPAVVNLLLQNKLIVT